MSLSMIHNTKKPLHDVLGFRKEINGITIDIVLQWYVDGYSDIMVGYVNGIHTIDGGTHIDGVKASLTRTLNILAKNSKIFKDEDITLSGEHVREGLTCIVSISIQHPKFEGQTHKTRLVNPYVREIVDKSVQEYLTKYFKLHPYVFESIISKSLNAYKHALAFKRVGELIRSKCVSKPSTVLEKPAKCSFDKSGRGDSFGGATNHGPYRCLQSKRTREQPWTDGAVATANNDSSFEKKRQKPNSCVPSSHHLYSLRQTAASATAAAGASKPSKRKDVSDKTLKDIALVSTKTRKFIPIGRSFQAELPIWIAPTREGKFYGSPGDSNTLKWLGTGVWPTYSRKKTVHYKKVGEGRPDSCSCASPGSTTCIKQHIKESRELLEKELKSGFYTWKFDEMGEEEGSKPWTAKEEQTFEALVKKSPLSSTQGFWKLASKALPSKDEKDLRSYYYNVFLINRARLLAKSSPEHIDSDDDQSP